MGVGADDLVTLGRISGVHGVRGWIKITSFTEPRGNIATYRTWRIRSPSREDAASYAVEAARAGGRQILAKLAGLDDRDAAAALIGREICVPRSALPACETGEYYWADLEGLTVQTLRGEVLGRVDHLIDTGAHAVLVLAGGAAQMIPFVAPDIVRGVDLDGGVITVDWDRSYWD